MSENNSSKNLANNPFKTLPILDLPNQLHQKIMRKVLIWKLRKPLLIIAGFLLINIILGIWHLWAKLSDQESWSILQSLFSDFEVSFSFLNYFISEFFNLFSFTFLFNLLINILLFWYSMVLLKSFKYQNIQIEQV